VASPLPPDDDGTRYVIERPQTKRERDGRYERRLRFWCATRTEGEARARLLPGDVLLRVRIDENGRELEREEIPWIH
jgi:hypothetical protein